MTPPAFQPDVVQTRLGLIRDLLGDLEQLAPSDVGALNSDRIRRHATERILTQLVELAVSINSHLAVTRGGEAPTSYRESFAAAARLGAIDEDLRSRLAPSVGLRNVLVHEYVEIDLTMVAAAVETARLDVAAYVSSVSAWLAGI